MTQLRTLIRLGSFVAIALSANLTQSEDQNIEHIGSCLWWGTNGVVVEGDYAYCALVNGLVVLDISDPQAIDIVSSLYMSGLGEGGRVGAVAKQGNYVYLARGYAGLEIVDVSNPSNPFPVGSSGNINSVRGVFVADEKAYLAAYDAGLVIYDVNIPSSPALLGSYDSTGLPLNVFVHDTLAFVAADFGGLHIVNVADPTKPVSVVVYPTPGYMYDVVANDSLAFLADWESLLVLDISDPSSPFEVGSYPYPYPPGPGQAQSLAVRDSLAYVGLWDVGVDILNLADPTSPVLLGSYLTPDYSYPKLFVVDSLVYTACWEKGVQVINAANPSAPALLGQYSTAGISCNGVRVQDSLAYVAQGKTGLKIVNISTTNDPTLIGGCDTDGEAVGLEVRDSLVYVADMDGGLVIVNVSDPSNPQIIGQIISGYCNDVSVKDTLAYLTGNGLTVVDVSDPTNPSWLGQCSTSYGGRGVAVRDSFAFVADAYMGFAVINVSNPLNPHVEVWGSTFGQICEEVFLQGDYVYLACGDGGLQIADVSQPTTPESVGMFPSLGYTEEVYVEGHMACLVGHWQGVEIVDISSPQNPFLVAAYNTPGSARGLMVRDSIIYLADYTSFMLLKASLEWACCEGLRGDADASGELNVADLTFIVDYLFRGGPAPSCFREGDVDGSGTINVADLTYLVDYLFRGGDPPPPCP